MEPITNQNIHNRDWEERERKRVLREISLQVDFEEAKSAFARFRFEVKILARQILEKGFTAAISACLRKAQS